MELTIMSHMALQTSVEVWEYLLIQGGLDPKHYDADIIDEMRGKLKLKSSIKNDFKQELEVHQIEVEQLIIAFFEVAAPFSVMMSDLLAQFEKSGAFRSTNNLKVKFDFDSKLAALEFDLQHFRSWQTQFIYAMRPVNVYKVNVEVLSKMYSDLQIFLDVSGSSWNPQHQEVKFWIEEYNDGYLPKYLPAFRSVGNAEFDQAFGSLYEVWRQVWADCLFHQITRNSLTQSGTANDEYLQCLQILESDRWLGQFLLILEVLHSRMIGDAGESWLLDKVHILSGILDHLPRTLRNKTVLTQELMSFLELPIWKQRYDLYAAWISTQMMTAINDTAMKYIHEDGAVTFSFARTHLATSRKYNPTLELWSELRTPLANPKGKSRLRSIQPDYSLLTEIADAERSTLLVVECKQYRRAGSKNFALALEDYSRGRPNARVVITNYGKGNSDIVAKVDKSLRSRVKVIHEMRPNSFVAIQEFQDYILDTIVRKCVEQTPEAAVTTPGTQADITAASVPVPLRVTLSWGEEPKDLDLHLTILTPGSINTPVTVDYQDHGSLTSFPWAKLGEDKREGFGPEEIQVSQWVPSSVYHFTVNNFSNEISLTQSKAKIAISLNAQPPIEIPCPITGGGESWEVFSYDTESSQLRICNRLQKK